MRMEVRLKLSWLLSSLYFLFTYLKDSLERCLTFGQLFLFKGL